MNIIYQIYYSAETRLMCYQHARLVDNTGKLTVFFENDIIAEKISNHIDDDYKYIGILSPRFKHKMANKRLTWFRLLDILENNNTDVVSFFKPSENQKNNIEQLNRYHRGVNPSAVELMQKMLELAGVPWDCKQKMRKGSIIMSNYWFMKKHIAEKYLSEVLYPCMKVLKNDMKDEVIQNSQYNRQRKGAFISLIRSQLQMNYYPMHPFLLERLPSVFLNINNNLTITQI